LNLLTQQSKTASKFSMISPPHNITKMNVLLKHEMQISVCVCSLYWTDLGENCNRWCERSRSELINRMMLWENVQH